MENEHLKALLLALEASPENLQLRKMVADALMEESNWRGAEEHLKYILQKKPANAWAKHNLAKLYYEQEAYSTAIIILEELLEEEPDDVFKKIVLPLSVERW